MAREESLCWHWFIWERGKQKKAFVSCIGLFGAALLYGRWNDHAGHFGSERHGRFGGCDPVFCALCIAPVTIMILIGLFRFNGAEQLESEPCLGL